MQCCVRSSKFSVSILPIKHFHILTLQARWHATSCSSSRPFIANATAMQPNFIAPSCSSRSIVCPQTHEPDTDSAALLPLLLPLPLLPLLPFCCYCSAAAACGFSSADFLGACPSLNCHCADTSFTTHATHVFSSPLPLLSFVASFGVSIHLHDFPDSSYQHFNLMPCFPLRQVVCQILFAWNSSHFYSS